MSESPRKRSFSKTDLERLSDDIQKVQEEVKRLRRTSESSRDQNNSRSNAKSLHKAYFGKKPIDNDILDNNLANTGILDSGCTRAVFGKQWFEVFQSGLTKPQIKKIKSYKSEESFKFGDGPIFKAIKKKSIPVKIGNLETRIEACMVACDIVLLLISKTELEN